MSDGASPSPQPPSPRYTGTIRVYYFDTDAGGVVHNVAYLRMIEVVRTDLAANLGWTMKEMADTGIVPVVARTEIDYLKPARLGDDLRIEGRLVSFEKIRFHLEFEIFRASDGVLLTRCRQTMVTVNIASGRPQPVLKRWVETFPDLISR
ncbi:acyl-CoA thioester hydrolase [Verrucomicrobium sp. GAS474]|uniref:acyl-CoA thioesterase n=1 Tax=Verrucomicrobium sp. GAS474 TaxID=1882831 RepID=UPI00087CD7CB|nr:thioesterase family protein [Verrucomicrobium sp. GAS474]SDU22562.1 acyl-CoA thioester hydrolase [Verrucomicrobium sp. GAS474]